MLNLIDFMWNDKISEEKHCKSEKTLDQGVPAFVNLSLPNVFNFPSPSGFCLACPLQIYNELFRILFNAFLMCSERNKN